MLCCFLALARQVTHFSFMVWLPDTTPANMNLQGPNRYQQRARAGETEAQRIKRLSDCRHCNKKLEPTEEHPSFRCPHCSSRYCSECLETMFKEALKYGGIWPPLCYYCARPITVYNVSDILSQATKAKIPEKEATRPLFCANPKCTEEGNTFLMDIAELNRRVMVDCQVCGTWTCSECRMQSADHTGDRFMCKEDERYAEIKEAHDEYRPTIEESANTGKNEDESVPTAGEGHGRRESLAEVEGAPDTFKKYRTCPRCGDGIQKISGCDAMTCQRCQQTFCFRCGKRGDPWVGDCGCPPIPIPNVCRMCLRDDTECRCHAE